MSQIKILIPFFVSIDIKIVYKTQFHRQIRVKTALNAYEWDELNFVVEACLA